MEEFEINYDKEYLRKRMGSISQLAGVKRYKFIDGKAKDIEAVDVNTGSGLSFTVLPGRGMDIAWTRYKGVPLSYISKTGVVSPSYYEHEGLNWLRNFFGGMLTTCGLTNVGWPCQEVDTTLGNRNYGLHGRISNMGADNICIKEEWKQNKFVMSMAGRVKEAILHGEHLILERNITTELAANKFKIHDEIENASFKEQPLMILYHINIGYPVLDQHSRLFLYSKKIEPANEISEKDIDNYKEFQTPTKDYEERLYFHDLGTHNDDEIYVGIINDKLKLGIYLKFNKNQLPQFSQWKMMNEAEYVIGLEPGNCLPVGRTEQKKRGNLEHLKPGQKKEIDLNIGVLDGNKQIDEFEKKFES